MLIILLALTGFMGYQASKVQMSYEFAKAIPQDNPRYIEYVNFRKVFGDDGNTMLVGIQTKDLFTVKNFNAYASLHKALKQIGGVEDIISIPEAVGLKTDDSSGKLQPYKIFHYPYTDQAALDSDKAVFFNLKFYKGLLYNTDSNSYAMAVRLNKDSINTKSRAALVRNLETTIDAYRKTSGYDVKTSGLPFIRGMVAAMLGKETNWFLIASLVLSAVTLLLFFRSFSAMLMSMLVVGMGVVWSTGTMALIGYKITLLTALIPPLVVVIGVPNCIYFLNKYHTAYLDTGNKREAIITMIGRMGVVTLFCNITAAIGFAVFALTKSALLKEFGVVAGINLMVIFFISLIFIPVVLSYLPVPGKSQTKYLRNKVVERFLLQVEHWAINRQKWVIGITVVVTAVAAAGMFRLKSEGFIVDDLPKNNKVYKDLKWYEHNFKGLMPLEVLVDTRKKKKVLTLRTIEKIDSFSAYVAQSPFVARPLSFVEGLKFARQGMYSEDSGSYSVPTGFDLPILGAYLRGDSNADSTGTGSATARPAKPAGNGLSRLMSSVIDSNQQLARITINMQDVGSARLPVILEDYERAAGKIFDTAHYKLTFTGSSITFLEGTTFIVNGLKESIFYAFLLITLCMLYLFRSFRILICSLIPNIIPLLITAGVMGWLGISLKPSTVLIFSVALGIAIDVTIRFLVNYRQELPLYNNNIRQTLSQTIRHTGLSIVYTSLVLIAGFVIFCISEFGGTKTLGWLTSLTLVTGTVTNLVLLPVLLFITGKKRAAN